MKGERVGKESDSSIKNNLFQTLWRYVTHGKNIG